MPESGVLDKVTKFFSMMGSFVVGIGAIIAAVLYVGTHVTGLQFAVANIEKKNTAQDRSIERNSLIVNKLEVFSNKIEMLEAFADEGKRYTDVRGIAIEKRVDKLETVTSTVPQIEWFREMFHDFKNDVNSELIMLRDKVGELGLNIQSLKSQVKEMEKHRIYYTPHFDGNEGG